MMNDAVTWRRTRVQTSSRSFGHICLHLPLVVVLCPFLLIVGSQRRGYVLEILRLPPKNRWSWNEKRTHSLTKARNRETDENFMAPAGEHGKGRRLAGHCPAWSNRHWKAPRPPDVPFDFVEVEAHWLEDPHRSDATAALGGLPWAAPALATYRKASAAFDTFLMMAGGYHRDDPRLACRIECSPGAEVCGKKFDIIDLNAFPNSGNTWTKKLWAIATGIAPEAIYKEGDKQTDYGTWYSSTEGRARVRDEPAFVKTHHTSWGIGHHPSANVVARTIHLVRNVLDNVYANYRYWNQWSEEQHLPVMDFEAIAPKFARLYVYWHCVSAVKHLSVDTLVIKYEDMLMRPMQELAKILNFVGINFKGKDIVRAVVGARPKARHGSENLPHYVAEGRYNMSILNMTVSAYGDAVGKALRTPARCWSELLRATIPDSPFRTENIG